MKSVAVIQSNYIPWKGYFDIINDVDTLIFYDDVQYTKNDWRNRNKIKTTEGTQWLSIPAGAANNRLICDVVVDNKQWQKKHWRTLSQSYSKAPHFSKYAHFLEGFYVNNTWRNLSELNQYLIRNIARNFLDIQTEFIDSREFSIKGCKQERLLDLLKNAGATRYVSGPAAKSYIEEEKFDAEGIELIWKDYGGYPEYPQFHPPFEHGVTVLDLLFQTGPKATWYIWGWRNEMKLVNIDL